MHFGRNSNEDCNVFSVNDNRKQRMSVCITTGKVSFNLLVRMMFNRILHCKVTIFPFVIIGQSIGR